MLEPSPEQLSYQAEIRRYLDRSWPTEVTRRAVEGEATFDAQAWAGLCRMGAAGLLVPAEWGGSEAGVTEAALVSEELGRGVVAAPYLSTAVLAPRLLTALGDRAAAERYLPGIAAGSTIATTAHLGPSGRWAPQEVAVQARDVEDRWLLDGSVRFVTDLPSADLVLVVAATPDGLGVFAVTPGSPGVESATLDCLDRTQPVGTLRLHGAVAERLAPQLSGDQVAAALRDTSAAALACLCAGQVGGAERCLELAVEYARQRVQFGRTIGSYQAIKHRCADMLARVESARSTAHHLIAAVESGAPDTDVAASLAKAVCSDAFDDCAADMLQIHGGIGFTWEHDAHLYLKRARATAHLFGDPVYHRGALARRLVGRDAAGCTRPDDTSVTAPPSPPRGTP